jgi:hypothetical protein
MIISLKSVDWLIFLIEMWRVFCEVGSGFLNAAWIKFIIQMLKTHILRKQHVLLCNNSTNIHLLTQTGK